MNREDKISRHFKWYEVVDSPTALRDGIDNTPPPELIPVIKRTARCMDDVRDLLDAAVIPSSWYRSPALERVICDRAFRNWVKKTNRPLDSHAWAIYLASKSHPRGESVDFKAPSFGTPRQVFDAIRASNIIYDQLIIEFDAWVHASFSEKPRMDAFLIDSRGRRNV